MSQISGYILVGGASRRMARDKAELRLGAQTFLSHIAAAVGSVAGSVTLVGARQNAASDNLPLIPDARPQWGALGGIHTAVAHCRKPWALVVACDLPFITSGFLDFLAAQRARHHDAVVPIQTEGLPQPLCAFYRRRPTARETARLIAAGEHRPRVLLERLRARYVPEESYETRAASFLLNINTPQEYARAIEMFAAQTQIHAEIADD